MSYQFSLNISPSTGADAMYQLKAFLVARGWLVRFSGGGTQTYLNGPAVVWTTSGAVANVNIAAGDAGKSATVYGYIKSTGWGSEVIASLSTGNNNTTAIFNCVSGCVFNGSLAATAYVKRGDGTTVYTMAAGTTGRAVDGIANATTMADGNVWFVAEMPDHSCQYAFQRNSSNTSWKLSYSTMDTGGFDDDGTPTATATVMPTASDGHAISTGFTLFPADGSCRTHLCADNASPYGWYMLNSTLTANIEAGCIICDPLLAGSYGADTDPRVTSWSSYGFNYEMVYGDGQAKTHYKKGVAGETYIRCNVGFYMSSESVRMFPFYNTQGAGTDPLTGYEVLVPVVYGRSSGDAAGSPNAYGWKGFSSMIRWIGSNRSNNDTVSVASSTSKEWLVRSYSTYGPYLVPWDGSTTPTW